MWEDNILPLGVGAVTEAKSWQAADAPGGTVVILDHRPPKHGSPGTVLDGSHSYVVAVADREGFLCVRAMPAAQLVRLAHWAKTDLNYYQGDLEGQRWLRLTGAEAQLIENGVDVVAHNPSAKIGGTAMDLKMQAWAQRWLTGAVPEPVS